MASVAITSLGYPSYPKGFVTIAKIKNEERKKIRYNAISFTGLKGGEN